MQRIPGFRHQMFQQATCQGVSGQTRPRSKIWFPLTGFMRLETGAGTAFALVASHQLPLGGLVKTEREKKDVGEEKPITTNTHTEKSDNQPTDFCDYVLQFK